LSFHKSKKQKTTFGEVLLGGIVFLVGDIFIAFTSLRGLLIPLGFLEVVAMVLLIMRATWDALPKSVQNPLS
jgi:hypothetical protein